MNNLSSLKAMKIQSHVIVQKDKTEMRPELDREITFNVISNENSKLPSVSFLELKLEQTARVKLEGV